MITCTVIKRFKTQQKGSWRDLSQINGTYRADVLIEALPYITAFAGKTFVIKYGGSVMENEALKDQFIQDIALLNAIGIKLVLVHGGGKRINQMLQRMNVPVEFKHGLRVTDGLTMQIVEMVLSGLVNKELTGALVRHGVHAIGMSGKDDGLLTARKKTTRIGDENVDLGFVGTISSVNTYLLNDVMQAGYLPVVSPVASDGSGQTYNINADFAAGAIAASLGAEKLILLSDTRGLYECETDPCTFLPEVEVRTVREMMEDGRISGGMLPKMTCCLHAIEMGTRQVALIDGRVPHSLLLELFTDSGHGTLIKREETQ